MELGQLHAVLQACISQDPIQRKAAEDTLAQVSSHQHLPRIGYCLHGLVRMHMFWQDTLLSPALVQAQQAPGVLVQLLQLAADPAGDSGIRQVAVITFKNVVKRHWESRGKPAQLLSSAWPKP